MVTATRYMVEKLEGRDEYRILNRDAPLCPSCGVLLSGYDTRARHIVSSEGRSIWFRLRRLRCPVCCRLHLEVPDFMRANKHYTADMIAAVIAGGTDDCPADNSTIRRWRNENHPPGLPRPSAAPLVSYESTDAEED